METLSERNAIDYTYDFDGFRSEGDELGNEETCE
jgi:hypothetical protein